MAIMIPTKPYAYTEKSQEDKIFQAFKSLPDAYYVFHSFKINQVVEDTLYRHEMDFLVFHPALGILCIECKNGLVTPANGEWYYSPQKAEKNLEPMKNGGPFRQSESRMNDLKAHMGRLSLRLKEDNSKTLLDHCKLAYAVCFPGIDSLNQEIKVFNQVKRLKEMLPLDAPGEIVICAGDLQNAVSLETKIKCIFSFNVPDRCIETGINGNPLNKEDVKNLFERILCPNYHIIETADEEGKTEYISLNEEQQQLLGVIKSKAEVAISGLAGTGKTVLAIQIARVKSAEGDKVLFLCSNDLLREELKNNYQMRNKRIEFVDMNFIRKHWLEGIDLSNKEEIYDCLNAIINNKRNKFCDKDKYKNKYSTIVVDEGQDLGKPVICDILYSFYRIMRGGGSYSEKNETSGIMSMRNKLESMRERKKEGFKKSFYIFYDEFQADNSSQVPDFIKNIENHVELETICRNTKNIANTALKPVIDYGLNYCQRAEHGEKVKIYFYKSVEDLLRLLDERLAYTNGSTVILTCKDDERESELASCQARIEKINQITYYKAIIKGKKRKILFTSWRKFKGLERQNVVILDFAPDQFFVEDDSTAFKSFYVSVSRARERAYILVSMFSRSKAFLYSDNLLTYTFYKTVLKNANKESLSARNREIVEFWETFEKKQNVDFLEVIASVYNDASSKNEAVYQISQGMKKENKIHRSLNQAFMSQFKAGRKTNVRDAICNALSAENMFYLDILERDKRRFLQEKVKMVEEFGIPAPRFVCDILCYGLVWTEIVLSIRGIEPTIFDLSEFCIRFNAEPDAVKEEYYYWMENSCSVNLVTQSSSTRKVISAGFWRILKKGIKDKLEYLFSDDLKDRYVIDEDIERKSLVELDRIEKETMEYLLAIFNIADHNGQKEYEYGFWEWFASNWSNRSLQESCL